MNSEQKKKFTDLVNNNQLTPATIVDDNSYVCLYQYISNIFNPTKIDKIYYQFPMSKAKLDSVEIYTRLLGKQKGFEEHGLFKLIAVYDYWDKAYTERPWEALTKTFKE